jgi:hypothetical protein
VREVEADGMGRCAAQGRAASATVDETGRAKGMNPGGGDASLVAGCWEPTAPLERWLWPEVVVGGAPTGLVGTLAAGRPTVVGLAAVPVATIERPGAVVADEAVSGDLHARDRTERI